MSQPTGGLGPQSVSVGIVSAGIYIPEPVLTAADIARESGIPEDVIRHKFGITQKHMAGPNDHTNQMAIWAAQDCLSKTDIRPEEIDLVLCTTEEWKEYLLQTAGIKLAYEIGATRAWAIDVQMRCGTTIATLKIARDMMTADPDLNTVLIVGGYRNGDLSTSRTTAPPSCLTWRLAAEHYCCARTGRAMMSWVRISWPMATWPTTSSCRPAALNSFPPTRQELWACSILTWLSQTR